MHVVRLLSGFALYGAIALLAACGSSGPAPVPGPSPTGEPGVVWKVGHENLVSHDDGEHWQRQATPGGGYVAEIWFSDRLNGWMVGESGAALVTKDGGVTWTRRSPGEWDYLGGVTCSDADHAWAIIGDSPVVVGTEDGGLSWSSTVTGSFGLFGIACSGSSHLWAVGAHGVIVASGDGGSSWRDQRRGVAEDWLGDVVFVSDHQGWAVGTLGGRGRGAILATQDGETWSEQTAGTRRTLYGVSATDSEHVWAVGEGGVILATRDGGLTWERQSSGTKAILYDVSFADPLHGWVAGCRPIGDPVEHQPWRYRWVILGTDDGGITWRLQFSSTNGRPDWGRAICAPPRD